MVSSLPWKKPARYPLAILVLLLFSFFTASAQAARQHVLLLNSYHQGFTWTDEQVAGILSVLHREDSEVDLYIEYMDAKRFPDPAGRALLRERLRKYAVHRHIDLLLTTDNLALDFILRERDALFSGVPIVFSGVNGFRPEMLAGAARVTGVVEEIDPAGTLEVAFRLQPQARTVLAIFDGTESGRLTQATARAAAQRFAGREFRFLDNPTMAEVLAAVRQLPAASFILLGNFNRDRDGAVFSHEEALAKIGASARVPIYGLWEFIAGKGIVGGSLLSGELQGEHAALLAQRILDGEFDLPVEPTSPTRLLFDHRQLQRFALDPRLLPPNGEVLYRPLPFYVKHRNVLLGGGAIISGLTLVIAALLWSMATRRKAAAELREKTELLQTIIDALPIPIYYKDRNGVYLGCNQAFETFLGLARQRILGQSVYGVAPQALAEKYFRADQELFARGGNQSYEAPMRYADGSIHNVFFHKAVFAGRDGVCAGLVGAMLDITERKSRERELEALAHLAAALRAARSSEEMCRILLDCLMTVLKVNGALVLTRTAADRQALIEAGVGVCAPLVGKKLAPELKPVRTLFDERRPCQADGEALAAIFQPLPAGMEHVACVPLLAHDNAIGAIGASRSEPFTDEKLRLLSSMAEMGASAIHRCELHERTQLQLDRLSTLQSIDRAIIGSHDFAVTMEVLLDQVLKQMRVDAAAILLCQSGGEILTFGAGRGFRTAAIRATRLQPGEGIVGRIVRASRLLFLSGREEVARQTARGDMVRAEEFVFYCGVPLVARGETKGVLELFHRTPLLPTGDWLEFLEALGLQAAIALDNARLFAGLQQSNSELLLAYDRAIEGWSRALDLRDRETEGHSLRVTEMTLHLARAMGIAEAELVHLRHGALLHDIGKMGIPDQILLKPGPLTPAEWEIMKTHPKLAYQLLSPIEYLRPALDIPYGHHEKWDGSGYPMGLAGEQIPLAARLFAIVDVWDALLSDRAYRPGWPEEKVRRYLREEAGRHFDPQLVEIFLSLR